MQSTRSYKDTLMNKNIVIIGGGQKSGKMIADRFRQNNDNVYVLSHTQHHDVVSADFSNIDDVLDKFGVLLDDLDHIDLFVYNTNLVGSPRCPEDYQTNYSSLTSRKSMYVNDWHKVTHYAMVLPHLLTLKSLEKMDSTSSIVYMTTFISYSELTIENEFVHLAAYKGSKSVQNHLMLGFAAHNNVGATCCSIAPHYPYEDPDKLAFVVDKVYKAMSNMSKEDNGKIIQCFP